MELVKNLMKKTNYLYYAASFPVAAPAFRVRKSGVSWVPVGAVVMLLSPCCRGRG